MTRNTRDINATRTSGSGELPALLKETERAIPVVATAQLVVASRRVRQILLRYISPLYRCASKPSSAAVNGSLGFCTALMSLPPLISVTGDSGEKNAGKGKELRDWLSIANGGSKSASGRLTESKFRSGEVVLVVALLMNT